MATSNLRQMTQDFYKKYEENQILREHLLTSLKNTKKITSILKFFNLLFFNGSVIIFIIFLITGQQLLLMPVYLPLIDHETILGYLINIALQIGMGFIGFFTFTSYDTSVILYGYHGVLMSKILKEKAEEIGDEKYIEIVKYYEKYQAFMKEFEKLVKFPFLMAICVNFLGLILCILVGINDSVVLAIGGSIGLFVGFLLPSITMMMIEYQVMNFLSF